MMAGKSTSIPPKDKLRMDEALRHALNTPPDPRKSKTFGGSGVAPKRPKKKAGRKGA